MMKKIKVYNVKGPRILVKVKKFNKAEVLAKKKFVEGSTLIEAPDLENSEDATELETINQTTGTVVQLGTTAYKRKDSGCDGTPWVEIGDEIHFSRHGAMRIKTKDADFEYWVLNDKDVLLEEHEEEVETKEEVLNVV